MDKSIIRQMMKEKRLLASQETFSVIFDKLKSHQQYQQSKIIGCYVSLPSEIQTLSFIEESLKTHRVCVPRVHQDTMDFYEIHSLNDLEPGHFNVLEPKTNTLIQPQDIDLMIVPLLAYDNDNYRVGYGKGYYDKYFASGFQGYKIGLAYSFQHVEHIAYDQYDYPLDEVITERRHNE